MRKCKKRELYLTEMASADNYISDIKDCQQMNIAIN